MSSEYDLIKALAAVLGAAAATTVIFHRLRLPVVIGYIAAGVLLGLRLPFSLSVSADTVHALSELGVILLMFTLGLEFGLYKLMRVGTVAVFVAVIQVGAMTWLGFSVGRLFGWSVLTCVFTGTALAISSTTIVAKTFEELGAGEELRRLVMGILIVQDLIAVLVMGILPAIAAGAELSIRDVVFVVFRLIVLLIVILAAGMLVVPRAMRAVARLARNETTVIAGAGICFGAALLAEWLGYSVALGAFLAGSLITGSGEDRQLRGLIAPIRDIFVAVFFVSVGMLIDPAQMLDHWVAICVFGLTVLIGMAGSVSIGAFLMGKGLRLSVQAGMSLAQIGEFSFVIATLGAQLGVTPAHHSTIIVGVSAVTALLTPWLMRASGPVAAWIDRKLPHTLQTFATLYGSWLERLQGRAREDGGMRPIRKLGRAVAIDAVLLVAILVGSDVSSEALSREIAERGGITIAMAHGLFMALVLAASVPLFAALIGNARRLGGALAEIALPPSQVAGLDLADAPRRVLRVTLQLAITVIIGLPFVAVTQPFVPPVVSLPVLALVLAALAVSFWKHAGGLQGHVRAGIEVIAAAIKKRIQANEPLLPAESLSEVRALLPGIGEPVSMQIREGSPVIGKTLAELNLRGVTGATVLAIVRGGQVVSLPAAKEKLGCGDIITLAGTQLAVEATRTLIEGESPNSVEHAG